MQPGTVHGRRFVESSSQIVGRLDGRLYSDACRHIIACTAARAMRVPLTPPWFFPYIDADFPCVLKFASQLAMTGKSRLVAVHSEPEIRCEPAAQASRRSPRSCAPKEAVTSN